MRAYKLFYIIICAIVPAAVIASAWASGSFEAWEPGFQSNDTSVSVRAEWQVRQGMMFRDELLDVGNVINTMAGRREIVPQGYGYELKQNGIFVSDDGLMKNIDPPIGAYVSENIAGVTAFAENMRQSRKQTYLMLIPTAGAIMQQKLPQFAESVMVNQRKLIEDVYSRSSGSAVTIDTYSALFERRNQYIYYRTENNLTPLGGYFVYASMLSRLGLGQAQFKNFDIEYLDDAFYGDLCEESGYKNVVADSISLFRYNNGDGALHEFLVTIGGEGRKKTYHTLFPENAAQLGDKLDIFLGGMSAVTDIKSSSTRSEKILVFADKTALAYAPLLANNCAELTLVDLFYGKAAVSEIDPDDYDKIIFAYGAESFMHTNIPSRAADFFSEF